MGVTSVWTKIYQTLASVKTGIFLIIVVGIFSAVGTVILQRPTSEPADMARAYSPETLALLDRVGLTDIFHVWWFVVLLCLFCTCLIFVTVDRWPNAWRLYAKPVRYATPGFRASLPQKAKFAVTNGEAALSVAERVFAKFGFHPQRASEGGQNGLFGERQRFSVFAVYVVHISLLCIFAGYIADGIVGWRGNINVPEGQALGIISIRDNKGGETKKPLPFLIRCDAAGMEAYADGSPKKWWSDLTIIEDNREVLHKKIIVNDPLTYKGVRIYQANMGQSSTPKTLTFEAIDVKTGAATPVEVPLKSQAALPNGESLSVLRWVPDYYIQDNEVFTKSEDAENPAVQLAVTSAAGETKKLWILYDKGNSTKGQDAPYDFALKNATWTKFTGLEVSHQPGQYGVWIGVVIMAFGLILAFYTQHQRIWAAVAEDGKQLWIGGTTNKNRERFQARFAQIQAALEQELGSKSEQSQNSSSAAV
jgi:cytochrome c biogenesis protein